MWIIDRDDRGYWIRSGRTKLGPFELKSQARFEANRTPEPQRPEPPKRKDDDK